MPESQRQEGGRGRWAGALLRPSRQQLVVAALLALVGFAAVTQVQDNESDESYAGLREQDLIDVLEGLAGTSQRAEDEIRRLERTRDDLLSETDSRQAALDTAQDEIDTLNILAGLVPVSGPGIRITITEVSGEVSVGSMLDTLQSLRSAGAEAVQVNAQLRLVAQSSIEDAVGGLLIDNRLLSPPYVLDVIGDPDTLTGSLTFREGPRARLVADGAEVEIQQVATLDIESVRQPSQPEFAQPVEE